MNTYDHWVAQTVADQAAHPAPQRSVLSTLEFARYQIIAAEPERGESLLVRLRALITRR